MASAARIVLRDWSIGKFDRYTTPPSASAPVTPVTGNAATAQSESSTIMAKLVNNSCDNIAQFYVKDEVILSTIQTRKERRKQGGLVKFAYGSIDFRKVAMEELWNGLEQDDDDDDVEGMDIDGEEEEEEEEEDGEDEDEDEDGEASDAETGDSQEDEEDGEDADEDEDEDESEIELPSPSASRKQKRKRGPEKTIPLPPAKKVAFSIPSTRGSKSDRQKLGPTTKGKSKEPMKTAQQKKIPQAVQVSSRAAVKSQSSKPGPNPTATANPVHKTLEKNGKTAFVTTKTKAEGSGLALARQSKDKSESASEVYDFGKFF